MPDAHRSLPQRRRTPVDPEPLSDAEILAILIGTHRDLEKTLDVAQLVLARTGGLAGLRRASVRELCCLPGIGPARALRIQAALVLGRRSVEVVRERLGPYRGARDVYEYLRPKVAGAEKEVFYSLLLDSKNRLIREDVVSIGTLTASLVHPREVFCAAIRECAASVIVAHNHPSGSADPSAEDMEVTARLKSVGEVIGIPLLDHVIIGAGRYVSLAERGGLRGGG